VTLDTKQLTCFSGTPDFTTVDSVMVYLGTAGTYYLDNLRALPPANASSPSVTGALNGAGFVVGAPLPEGGIASLFGSNLAAAINYASNIPLPNSLEDISVTVNGIPAPLFFVSPLQINVQIPWNALPSGSTTGTGNIVVTAGTGVSQAFSAPLAATAPALLTTHSGTGQAIAINPDGSLADSTHPAKPGEVLVLLANGLGPVTPAISDGVAPGAAERNTISTPTVLIGGVSAQVQFSGLSPQFVALNQINVQVPSGVTPSGAVPIQIKIGGVTTSNKVTIAVSQP
jgi:adhesin/invasin